jgi:hypothetical protein
MNATASSTSKTGFGGFTFDYRRLPKVQILSLPHTRPSPPSMQRYGFSRETGCPRLRQENDPSESILSSHYLAQQVALSSGVAAQQGQKWLNGLRRPAAITGLSLLTRDLH